jgi:hypothetical protein
MIGRYRGSHQSLGPLSIWQILLILTRMTWGRCDSTHGLTLALLLGLLKLALESRSLLKIHGFKVKNIGFFNFSFVGPYYCLFYHMIIFCALVSTSERDPISNH